MRHLAIGLLALVGCHPAYRSPPDQPIDPLVGSWRAPRAPASWQFADIAERSDLDIHADGTFAEAWSDADDNQLCSRTGTVKLSAQDYLWFAITASDCPAVEPFGGDLQSLDVDQFVFDLHYTYTKSGESNSETLTYQRQPGPLVSLDPIGHHAPSEWSRRRVAEADREQAIHDAHNRDVDDPDGSEDTSEPDAKIAQLMVWSQDLLTLAPALAGYERVFTTTLGRGTDWAQPYAATSSWTLWPDFEAQTDYLIVVLVSDAAIDPHVTLQSDGIDDVVDFQLTRIEDPGVYVMSSPWRYPGTETVELEIHYTSGSSEPSILLLYKKP